MIRTLPLIALAAALAVAIPAEGASKSCTRGGAKLESKHGTTQIVRVKVKRRAGETRHEKLLACWVRTGRRTTVVEEIDNGLDNIARTAIEVNDGRYVGVRAHNEGGVSESIVTRVYDAAKGRLLHTSAECQKVDQVDFNGVNDVAFLPNGGMAMACNRLFLYRNAKAELEVLEPAGTFVRQVAVSRHSHGFNRQLFWTVVADDGTVTTKSLAL